MRSTLTDALDRYEPGTPPARRYNRLVRVGTAEVLEMRDPNEGQGGGSETKSRHQYVLAGGRLWRRRLPPESVGDEWLGPDDEDPARWTPMEPRLGVRSLIDEYAESARNVPVAVVRRLRGQDAAGDTVYEIRREWVTDDGTMDVELLAGPVLGAWWEVPLPPCPDCGGDLVWWEAGYVPGARKCLGQPIGRTEDGQSEYDTDGGCGSMFTVQT